jgi:hypothetical protein
VIAESIPLVRYSEMRSIQILLRVIDTFDLAPPPPFGPGSRFLFSNDLALERYDDSRPGSGLPQAQQQRLAGTHSGFVTILRRAGTNDRFFSPAACCSSTTPGTSSTPWTCPTPQLMERSPRESPTPKAGCSISSCSCRSVRVSVSANAPARSAHALLGRRPDHNPSHPT